MKNFKKVCPVLFAIVLVAVIALIGTVTAFATETGNVAKVGDTGYASLTDALAAAKAGDTITFLADITEDVTINKAVTIDGAGKTYTGKMTVGSNLTVTVQNVNFVNSLLEKSTKSSAGTYTIKNCTFDGAGGAFEYALYFHGANKVTVEDCTVKDYPNFLYMRSSAASVSVKNVTVACPGYAVYFASGVNNASFEKLNVKNSDYGIVLNDSANRAVTIKNCTMDNVVAPIYGTRGANTISCVALGVNDFGVGNNTQNVKISAEAQSGNKIGSLDALAADAKFGDTIKLLKNNDATIELPYGTTLDKNGFVADNITVAVPAYQVTIGNTGYASLADALAAAKAGDTITFLADINENITIDKSITIDGANFKYTGTMTLEAKNATINFNDINFIEGYVSAAKGSSTGSYVNVTNCDFDGTSYYALAIQAIQKLTVDGCTAKNFRYGFIYIANAHNENVSVKDTTIENVGNYGICVNSGCAADLTNVTIKNSYYGLAIADTFLKSSVLTNCTFENVQYAIAVSGGGSTYNVKFVGENKMGGAMPTAQNIKYQLAAGATLTASEGLTIATDAAGYEVAYSNGVYSVVEKKVYVAQIGEKKYESLAEAIEKANAGDTITFLADITENVTINKNLIIDGAGKTFFGEMDLIAGSVTIKNVNFDGKRTMVYAIEAKGADTVIIEDCTAKNYSYGFLQVSSATTLTNVKNVTVTNVNYGIKIDYSSNVTIENVDITAGHAAVLNSNYGEKTITVKNSMLNILGTWTRNNITKSTYVFEGANTIDSFVIEEKLDNFKLAAGATLTAPKEITVTTDVKDMVVNYVDGKYCLVAVTIKVNQLNMRFGESLSLLFAMKQTNGIGDGCYAIITQADKTTKIEFASWLTTTINGNPYYVVEYSGIAAKEMTDDVNIQFFAEDGNAISAEFTTTIQTYAMSRLEKSTSTEFKTMLVDMLNYGAAAQKHFDYNTSTLANEGDAKAYQGFATSTMKPWTENLVVPAGDYYLSSNARFENSINLLFQIKKPDSFSKVVVSVTNHRDKVVTKEFVASDLQTLNNNYVVEFKGLVVADAREVVTCTIYDENGNVISTITDSIESYARRAIVEYEEATKAEIATPEEKKKIAKMEKEANLCEAFMKFADSSWTYFHESKS